LKKTIASVKRIYPRISLRYATEIARRAIQNSGEALGPISNNAIDDAKNAVNGEEGERFLNAVLGNRNYRDPIAGERVPTRARRRRWRRQGTRRVNENIISVSNGNSVISVSSGNSVVSVSSGESNRVSNRNNRPVYMDLNSD
jgi:hypothetical protein